MSNDMTISTGQDKVESNVSTIRAGQTEFEEKMTDMLDRHLKGIITDVKWHAKNLHEFNSELQVIRQDNEVAQWNIEAT
jgi:hypothetical protein